MSSRPTWRQSMEQTPRSEGPDNDEPLVEAGSSVLALYYMFVSQDSQSLSRTSKDLPFLQQKNTVVKYGEFVYLSLKQSTTLL